MTGKSKTIFSLLFFEKKSTTFSILSFLKYPLGVGLNNYSFSHDNFINYVETKYILTKFLNIQDGANNFNKILAEFGIFSLFFGYLMFKFFFNKKIKIELKYFFISFILFYTFAIGVIIIIVVSNNSVLIIITQNKINNVSCFLCFFKFTLTFF